MQAGNLFSVCQQERDLFAVGTSGVDFFVMLFCLRKMLAGDRRVKIYIQNRKSVLVSSSSASSADKGSSAAKFFLAKGHKSYGFHHMQLRASALQGQAAQPCNQVTLAHIWGGNPFHGRVLTALF